MSYDITIVDKDGNPVHSKKPHGIKGGTYCPESTELWLNITFNYSKIFKRNEVFGENGILCLQGMSVKDAIPIVQKAWRSLKEDNEQCWKVKEDENGKIIFEGSIIPKPTSYWDATDGNAKIAIGNLGELLEMAPEEATIEIG